VHFSCALPTHHTLARRELGAQFGSNLILMLSFFEGDQGDVMIFHELLNSLDEGPGHRLHGVGGQDFGFSLLANEVQPALQNLQPSHDDVQIHPVDGFRFRNCVADFVGGQPALYLERAATYGSAPLQWKDMLARAETGAQTVKRSPSWWTIGIPA